MDFLLIKKNNLSRKEVVKNYSESIDVFEKRGQKESLVISNEDFHFSLYDGFNTKCYYKKFDNGDFIVALGTLFYKSNFGADGLEDLFKDFCNNKTNLYNDLIGHYCIVIFHKKKLYAFNDYLGLLRLYHTDKYELVSSSFLAISKALKSTTPSTQEIFEYLIRGGMYGDKTILKEIRLIPRATIICISGEAEDVKLIYRYKRPEFYKDFNKMVEVVSDELLSFYKVITKEFQSNIITALSGGYDSRLMVGCLIENGIVPQMYVYGKPNSSDVRIAKKIAKGENFDIEHIDKNTYPVIKPQEYVKTIDENFYYFDGLRNEGLFDNGTEIKTRSYRSEGGKLQLNGAGGEVWRNFWKLNASKKKAINFVRHKYDIFDYSAYSTLFNKKEYFTNFTEKLKQSIGVTSNNLSRKEMEVSYPLFRYRYWQSINNSINLRFTNTLMPFMDPRFMVPSFDLPIQYKFDGKFEAAIIKKITPKLGAYNSNYGYNFVDEVPLKTKFKSLLLRNIPLFIKPFLRNKFKENKNDTFPYYLEKEYYERIVDLNDLFISKYIDVKKINDHVVMSRALSLEYFFKNIN